jgi:hypothetical protein
MAEQDFALPAPSPYSQQPPRLRPMWSTPEARKSNLEDLAAEPLHNGCRPRDFMRERQATQAVERCRQGASGLLPEQPAGL